MNVNTKKQQQQEENTKDLGSSTSSSANKQGNVPPSTSMDPTPASLSSFYFSTATVTYVSALSKAARKKQKNK
jgi:hypothetical protein